MERQWIFLRGALFLLSGRKVNFLKTILSTTAQGVIRTNQATSRPRKTGCERNEITTGAQKRTNFCNSGNGSGARGREEGGVKGTKVEYSPGRFEN